MSWYDSYTKEDLIYKVRKLEQEVEDLQEKLRNVENEKDHLNFLIDTELDPRIEREKKAYDRWATSPER